MGMTRLIAATLVGRADHFTAGAAFIDPDCYLILQRGRAAAAVREDSAATRRLCLIPIYCLIWEIFVPSRLTPAIRPF